ncbi:MAG: hypothetical protein QNJ22_13715 [Desulfosarcinaceae bacterium]|nr:hypothetical protein [Desulfosarcinaceae bacterium]
MKRSRLTQHRPFRAAFWPGGILLLCMLTLLGCGGTYGSFVYDEQVDQIFEELTVLPDHSYYFSGSDSRPDAIIAIDEAFTLESRIWKPVEMTDDQLKAWVFNPTRRAKYLPYTYGRYMLTDDGQRIGLWYSLYDWRAFATIRMLDDTIVQVSTPFDESYRRKRSNFFNSHHHDDD